MVNCKNFYEILYLIKRFENYTIYTYLKGVMATGLGGSQKYKKDRKISEHLKHKSIYFLQSDIYPIINLLEERFEENKIFWGRRLLG